MVQFVIAGSQFDGPIGTTRRRRRLLLEIENIQEEYRVGRPVLSPPVLTMATASYQDFKPGNFWTSLSHMG